MIQENYSELHQTIDEIPQPHQTIQSYAFLLVNSSSGSCVGAALVKSHIKEIKVLLSSSKLSTTFYIYDLYDQKQREMAFMEAKSKSAKSNRVYVVICGGDGTVQWVIEQSLKSGVDYERVIFTVVPIGTGNDFAKSIGWGNFDFNSDYEKFQKLALEMDRATVGYFDIWECSVECFDSGSIIEIKNGEEVEKDQNRFVKNFTNYFGIGTDAQIAYFAQKLRAKTIALKKIAYGFAGVISFFVIWSCGLKGKISQMLQRKPRSLKDQQPLNEITKSQIKSPPEIFEQLPLQHTIPVKISNFDNCMTFLNSTSSMDLQQIWKTPYKTSSTKSNQSFKEQCVDDGMIEIVSYRNQISLWFERAFHMAKKVEQGNGPFIIRFREPKLGQSLMTYIHVNGEPYKLANAKEIRVSQSPKFPDGKIKVLYRKPQQ